jgi:hypothetical protein
MEQEMNVFSVSSLIKNENKTVEPSLKKRTTLNKRYNNNKKETSIAVEVSSFKLTNKLTVNGHKKKKTVKNNKSDILWLHQEKLEYFKKLNASLVHKKTLATTLCGNERKRLEQEIKNIEEKTDENKYHALVDDVIQRYFDSQNRTNVSNNSSTVDEQQVYNKMNILNYVDNINNIEKEELAEEYCRLTNNGMFITINKLEFKNNTCDHCGGETTCIESFVTCRDCGVISDRSVPDFQVSYKDMCDTLVKTNFAYKRINRFKEILSTIQAKEHTDIPLYVYDNIREEIQKERIEDLSEIDIKKIKEYLKKFGMTAFYEHSPQILNNINGIEPVYIELYIEDKFNEMFDKIQDPYEIVKKVVAPARKSFLNYNFVLVKFCELLELHELRKNFTLLKNVDKLRIQDKIWCGICEILGWEYIKSI